MVAAYASAVDHEFAETGKPAGLMEADRFRPMLAFIASAESLDELAVPPNFGFHPFPGDREGYFAVTVTRNWRMTFTMIDELTVADIAEMVLAHSIANLIEAAYRWRTRLQKRRKMIDVGAKHCAVTRS